eukprot:scaffold39597_cov69-Phaeocystis_antarctica.AAC.5
MHLRAAAAACSRVPSAPAPPTACCSPDAQLLTAGKSHGRAGVDSCPCRAQHKSRPTRSLPSRTGWGRLETC